jgi:hypothetical protein
LTLEVNPLSQTREFVHLKEQTERPQHVTYKPAKLYSEISEPSYFKTHLARVQIVSASAPEMTSMQVCECIGVSLASGAEVRFVPPQKCSTLDAGCFCGYEWAYRVQNSLLTGDCNPWVSKMVTSW